MSLPVSRYGIINFAPGINYAGEIKNGEPNGYSVLYSKKVFYIGQIKNGDAYLGTFSANQPDIGKIHWKNIGDYEGIWEYGRPSVNCDFSENYREASLLPL